MKTQTKNKLNFNKIDVVELSDKESNNVKGGTSLRTIDIIIIMTNGPSVIL